MHAINKMLSSRSQTQESTAIQFHLYKVKKRESMLLEVRVLFGVGEWYLLEESTKGSSAVLVTGFCFTV